jgi:hypothetical protein
MKAEGEMGYEPSLLVLMEREMDMETNKVFRIASIIKDRSTAIDGRKIQNPTFESFMPHIKYLNLGREAARRGHHPQQRGDNSARYSREQPRASRSRAGRNPVADHPLLSGPVGGREEDQARSSQAHFQASWTEMERLMPLSDLRAGYDTLHIELEGEKSKYSYVREIAPEMDDSIPDFEKAAE